MSRTNTRPDTMPSRTNYRPHRISSPVPLVSFRLLPRGRYSCPLAMGYELLILTVKTDSALISFYEKAAGIGNLCQFKVKE